MQQLSPREEYLQEGFQNGQPGQLYISQDESESSAVVWMNERDNMCFMIDAFLDGDELLHIAESVVEILS